MGEIQVLSPSLYLSGFLLLTTLFLGYRYQSLDNELSVTKERLKSSDEMNQKLKDEINEQDRLINLKLEAIEKASKQRQVIEIKANKVKERVLYEDKKDMSNALDISVSYVLDGLRKQAGSAK
ncbi:hypothetical protein [uncultured Campylobacter sp.]|uniref:hypothetical protein n=1 Tax=uncultured Campylobacter sp. TaxID=218934 RepID=UPI00262F5291|nr:hypothetical protein [uncultured Campylobacter sp.]